eukprot:CAMPEP_0180425678 /NCGR_PEP_ID=MMETSP1036_2-20121128/5395_1 /TAXON_ID=632150 /ORGANISM="Azadinium spinosum, Strain 3D9" /LENGTH=536 /DNA_ID=CAMNT_0022431191 /DNA_START=1 /DNA_END=1609 /DNA_ORIENTATION=-
MDYVGSTGSRKDPVASRMSLNSYCGAGEDRYTTSSTKFQIDVRKQLALLELKLDQLSSHVTGCASGIADLQRKVPHTLNNIKFGYGRSKGSKESACPSGFEASNDREQEQAADDNAGIMALKAKRAKFIAGRPNTRSGPNEQPIENVSSDDTGNTSSAVSRSVSLKNVAQRMTATISQLKQFQRPRSQAVIHVWSILEDPETNLVARSYAKIMPAIILVSVMLTLLQTVEERDQLLGRVVAAVIETTFDAIFACELALRFYVCPNRCAFVSDIHNAFDALAVVPLVLRVCAGFVLPNVDDADYLQSILLLGVPAIRLLKVIRFSPNFQLLYYAFSMAVETLPALVFALALISLSFSSLIFFVEERANIPTFGKALWLSIVTMTTVGYGDTVPRSAWGSIIVSVLVIGSVMYMAVPFALIGHAFTEVWSDRSRILLMKRIRGSLGLSGYNAASIRKFFLVFDVDGNGALDFDEFHTMIRLMHLAVSDDLIRQLFRTFDNEEFAQEEFIEALFPGAALNAPNQYNTFQPPALCTDLAT